MKPVKKNPALFPSSSSHRNISAEALSSTVSSLCSSVVTVAQVSLIKGQRNDTFLLSWPFVGLCAHSEIIQTVYFTHHLMWKDLTSFHEQKNTKAVKAPSLSLICQIYHPVFQVHGHHINGLIHTSTHLISDPHVLWLLLLLPADNS